MEQRETYLLERIRNGDSSALEALYLLYAPRVRSFALNILKCPSDAEDITHNIFLRIWEDRELVSQAKSFKSYLFRMTRNSTLNLLKYKKYRIRGQNADAVYEPVTEMDDKISTDELLELIDTAIENLPERCRTIFKMSRFEHLTYNDIALRLGISPKTVQYHISNALTELRKFIAAINLLL